MGIGMPGPIIEPAEYWDRPHWLGAILTIDRLRPEYIERAPPLWLRELRRRVLAHRERDLPDGARELP